MKCKHGTVVEYHETPELDCVECAYEVIDLGPCYGCLFLDNGTASPDHWCSAWGMWIKQGYRRGVEHCNARIQRDCQKTCTNVSRCEDMCVGYET